MPKIYPVIMCGGSGTRLWPLSVESKPKQFHTIITEHSMLQETVLRGADAGALDVADPSFVCGLSQHEILKEQCQAIGVTPLKIVLEPCARNTAPVAAIVALEFHQFDPEGLVLLLPADHHIEDTASFWQAIEKGLKGSQQGHLTTLGIQPTRPETGYGYIHAGDRLADQYVKVSSFVEKPDLDVAQKYLADGQYFWNAGIFLFSPKVMMDAFEASALDILKDCQTTIENSECDETALYLDPLGFSKCRSESIDYAIMEKAPNVAMVCPVNVGWVDIGSWEALKDFKLGQGTDTCAVEGEAQLIDCKNTYVRSDTQFVAAIGMENCVIVVGDNGILVTKDDQTQKVKTVVQTLRADGKTGLV